MSSRPAFGPFDSIDDGNMSVNIVGQPTVIGHISMISYAFSWSGTAPVGTVSIEVSNDYAQGPGGTVINAGIWNVLPLEYSGSTVTTVPVSGNSGNGFIDIDACGAYAIRPIYTAGSGIGTLQCVIAGKVT